MNWSVIGILLFSWCSAPAAAVIAGFRDELLCDCRDCTDFTWMYRPTDGKQVMLITEKRGIVWEVEDFEGINVGKRKILDISEAGLAPAPPKVCINGERGFQHIQPHPDHRANGIVWIYYTAWQPVGCSGAVTTGPVMQFVRYYYRGDGMLHDEEVLLRGGPMRYTIHQGGGFHVGRDGYIWLTIGDGDWLARQDSSRLDRLTGKLVRIDFEGNAAPDNPWAAGGVDCKTTGIVPGGTPCREIWAAGLRNPYGVAINPNELGKTELMINDVGSETWEESNIAGSDYRGVHYGWPFYEGPCIKDVDDGPDCLPGAPRQTRHGYTFDMVEPYFWYYRRGRSSAITGALFVPNGVWPAEYDNARMVIDFPEGKILHLRNTGSGCRRCARPTPDWTFSVFHEDYWTVNMKFGPFQGTQAMYVIKHHDARNIRRIVSNVGGNRPPVGVFSVFPLSGPEGLMVTFDARGSSDPDGGTLTFRFDFGDGTAPVVKTGDGFHQHTYTGRGFFSVQITVTDGGGLRDDFFETVQVGTPPTAEILSPVEGTTYAVKDLFTLIGVAYHGETGEQLPDEALAWEMRQHHDNHWHPNLDYTRGNYVLSNGAPEPEDFWAAGNSYLEVLLYATDPDGLISVVSRLLMPKTLYVTIDSNPSGLFVTVDAQLIQTPIDFLTWENHELFVEVEDQCPYIFDSWNDGGSRSHYIVMPPRPVDGSKPLYVAQFSEEAICGPSLLMERGQQYGENFPVVVDGFRLELMSNGVLTLYFLGTLAWESPVAGDPGKDYYVILQGDCHLIIAEGTSSATKGPDLWTTKTSDPGATSCFLGAYRREGEIRLSEGTIDAAGDILWQDAIEMPTGAPTKSPAPSFDPSSTPSATPSIAPSSSPSFSPTVVASSVPSMSQYPTPAPSVTPSVEPSSNPSSSPSESPTTSFVPSISQEPSESEPSAFPSAGPSTTPSIAPTTASPTMSFPPVVVLIAGGTSIDSPIEKDGLRFELEDTGEFVLSILSSGFKLWGSGVTGRSSVDYIGVFQGDCHLISFIAPGFAPKYDFWTSGTSFEPEPACYVAVLPYDELIVIYEGTMDTIGSIVWESPLVFPEDPTAAPSPVPSGSPTDDPTIAPTGPTTNAPTSAPVPVPTASPTKSPSPSYGPTGYPTKHPSMAPTDSPTAAPVAFPPVVVLMDTDTLITAPIIESGFRFEHEADGNFALYLVSNGKLLWETGVRDSPDLEYIGVFQGDGNLVSYYAPGFAPKYDLWKSATSFCGADCFVAILPYDQKLVIYDGSVSDVVWEETIDLF